MAKFKTLLCVLIAAFFIIAGVMHFTHVETFAAIVPPALPFPKLIVQVTGVMEIVLATGLLVPKYRRICGLLFAPYLLSVLPANIYMAMADIGFDGRGLSKGVLWFRVALQFPLIALILWVSGHFSRRRQA